MAANEAGKNERRLSIPFWDGINAIVDKSVAKPQELQHGENARSNIIGTLEKREGQTILGTDPQGGVFTARDNYDLAFVSTSSTPVNGLYRLSGSTEQNTPSAPVSILSTSVFDSLVLTEQVTPVNKGRFGQVEFIVLSESITATVSSGTTTTNDSLHFSEQVMLNINGNSFLFIQLVDSTTLLEVPMHGVADRNTFYIDNVDYSDVGIYKLDANTERWRGFDSADAKNIAATDFSHTVLDGKVFFANGRDYNRYIDQDGKTVYTSNTTEASSGLGSLYNSPKARLINNYKTRLYLANYDWEGIHYGNTILQSSPPLGIISLIQGDVATPSPDTTTAASFYVPGGSTLANGVVAYYPFDNTAGTNGDASDQTGVYTLTNTGVSYGTGLLNDALDFSSGGNSNYLYNLTTLGITGNSPPVSISAWVYIEGSVSTTQTFATMLDPATNMGFSLRLVGGNFYFARYDGANTVSAQNTMAAFPNTWYHVLGTYDGGALQVYVNGILGVSATSTQNVVNVVPLTGVTGNPNGSTNHIDSVSNTVGLHPGMGISGTGIPSGSIVSSVTSNQIFINNTIASGGSGVALTFTGSGFGVGRDFIDNLATGGGAEAKIDEMGVWNRALTPTEAVTLFNKGAPVAFNEREVWTLPVTDNTYIYNDVNANVYEVWRINTKIATIKVHKFDDLNVYVYDDDITWYTTPVSSLTGNTTTGSNVITSLSSTSSLTIGMPISGPGVPPGSHITNIISPTSIQIYGAATNTITGSSLIFGIVDPTTQQFQSQDQIYVEGSVTGQKVYRWPNNPTLSGQDVKQYNTFKLSGGDESDITMMVNVGNVMIVANRSVIASWNNFILNYYDLGIGCSAPRGFTKAYGALYFIHYTGVYATSGGMPNIISSPIQPYLDGATKEGIESSVAGKKGRSVFFTLGDVTLRWPDGSVKRILRNACLEYSILQQNWYVHTNVSASAFETFLDSTAADRLAFTDDTSKDVKTFLEGTSDNGDEIFFRADTQPFAIAGNLEDLSNPETIILESERGSSVQCFVSLDDGDYYPIEGNLEKGISKLKIHAPDDSEGKPPVTHYIALSFRDGSKQRCKLGRAALTYVPVGAGNPP